MTQFAQLSLANLGGGGAEEIFQRELKRVLANIADPNTDWQTPRKIAIVVEFRTSKSRDSAGYVVKYDTRLAKPFPASSRILFRKNLATGAAEAVELHVEQADLFREVAPPPSRPAPVAD